MTRRPSGKRGKGDKKIEIPKKRRSKKADEFKAFIAPHRECMNIWIHNDSCPIKLLEWEAAKSYADNGTHNLFKSKSGEQRSDNWYNKAIRKIKHVLGNQTKVAEMEKFCFDSQNLSTTLAPKVE